MASKKRTIKHPKAKDGSESGPADPEQGKPNPADRQVAVFREDMAPDAKLPTDQRARLSSLLPQAQNVLVSIEDRMVALTIAATARWQPEQETLDTDEQAAPVFGDDEFDEFLSLVEETAQHAWFQEISKFMGLPESVINEVLVESLKSKFVGPSTMKKTSAPFVVHRRHNIPGNRR